MTRICTSIEQSNQLLELGIDQKSADMCWIYGNGEYFCDVKDGPLELFDVPAWSLAALLDILPPGKALIHDIGNHEYKCICNNIDTDFYDNPIDCCVKMIMKLKELNLLK